MDRARSAGRRTVKGTKNKVQELRRTAREVAKTVFDHRLGKNTLGSTNVKGKL